MAQAPTTSPRFSSKLAMVLTCMGMAVGTGNIWRFPMQVAENGGGTFLIPWFLFLFLWSIPLLILELAIGQKTRRGPFGAFVKLLGPGWSWMGGFVSICSMMIMCYYAVVTGWTLRYVVFALSGTLGQIDSTQAIELFETFRGTPAVLGFHMLALVLAGIFVFKGTRGIELANKVLIPLLVLILILGAVDALLLSGSKGGVSYLLTFEPERLSDPRLWIAGLTQSAWSTGAGWGLMLTYAVYAREKEDPVSTPLLTGLGNNGVELIVAMLIFPAVFALLGNTEAVAFVSGTSSKGGIAFQVAPTLFGQMPFGSLLNILFFFGLASAALTSLIALVELSARFFMDFQFSRKQALAITLGLCLAFGIPSALSDSFFDNQDFVWGVGLILSGLFICFAVLKYGAAKFTEEFLVPNAGLLKPGRGFQLLIHLVFIQGVVLLVWWLWNMADAGMDILISCFVQWGLVIGLLILLRSRLSKRLQDS